MTDENTAEKVDARIPALVDEVMKFINESSRGLQTTCLRAGVSPALGLAIAATAYPMMYNSMLEKECNRVFEQAKDNPEIPDIEKTKERISMHVEALHKNVQSYVEQSYLMMPKKLADQLTPTNGDVH